MSDLTHPVEQTAAEKLKAASEAIDLAIARNRIRAVGVELTIAQARVREARQALAG